MVRWKREQEELPQRGGETISKETGCRRGTVKFRGVGVCVECLGWRGGISSALVYQTAFPLGWLPNLPNVKNML